MEFVAAIVGACGGKEEEEWMRYVTHVVYLGGEGTPKVDVGKLREKGIEAIRVYGRKVEGVGMIYDGKALGQALEAMVGTGKGVIGRLGEKSRRNTLEG